MRMRRQMAATLQLGKNVEPHTLEDIRQHFDLPLILAAYKSGELFRWLQARYYEREASGLEELETMSCDSDEILGAYLCEIFGVWDGKPGPEGDIQRQQRADRLRTYTDDPELLSQVDSVAFNQEELAALLDEQTNPIYLCGDSFTIPASRKKMTYIGVNEPVVEFSGGVCFEDSDITIEHIKSELLTFQTLLGQFRSRLDGLEKDMGTVLKDTGAFIYKCEDIRSAYDEAKAFKSESACRRKAESVVKEVYQETEKALERQFDKNRTDGYCSELQKSLTRKLSGLIKLLPRLRMEGTTALVDELAQLLTSAPLLSDMGEFNDRLAERCRLPGCQKYLSEIEYDKDDRTEMVEGPLKLLAIPFCRYGYSLCLGALPKLDDDYLDAQKRFEEIFFQAARRQIHARIVEPAQRTLGQLEAKLQEAGLL